jgi:hypothetical protein
MLFRFSSLDKQEKGYLTREDFLRIPELAINPLGDRIVHSFFTKSQVENNAGIVLLVDQKKIVKITYQNFSYVQNMEDKVAFKDFVRVLAHFR